MGHSERVPAKLLIHESEKFTKISNFGYREPGAIAVLPAKFLIRESENFAKISNFRYREPGAIAVLSAKFLVRKVVLARLQIIVLRRVYLKNGSDVPREHFVKGACTSWLDRQTDRHTDTQTDEHEN